MRGGQVAGGVQAVGRHQRALIVGLDAVVVDAGVLDRALDEAVAGAVQREVAQEAVEVGAGFVVRGGGQRLRKKPAARPGVHLVAQAVDGIAGKGPVVEQHVGAVQADVKQRAMALGDAARFPVQALEHALAKAVVRIGRGHGGLLTFGSGLFYSIILAGSFQEWNQIWSKLCKKSAAPGGAAGDQAFLSYLCLQPLQVMVTRPVPLGTQAMRWHLGQRK